MNLSGKVNLQRIEPNGTVYNVGDYWVDVDFNLSTGQLVYEKDVEDTTNPDNGKSQKEKYIKKGLKINLQNRNLKDQRKIILTKTKAEIYI